MIRLMGMYTCGGDTGACNVNQFFDHKMQGTGQVRLAGPVIHLLSVPPGIHKIVGPQDTQMVRYRRRAHVHKGGDVCDTFLTVAEKPENLHPKRIAENFHGISRGSDLIDIRKTSDDIIV